MMAFATKTDWNNFYRTLQDKNKRGSLVWRIWRQFYLKVSRLLSRRFTGYALRPLELNLELTSKCNLQCRMCPMRVYDRITEQQYEVERINEVINNIGVKVVRFSGLGEPMVSPNFWELAESAVRNGCKIAMVTNGTFLEDSAIERLCAISLMITVSLDAATAETYKYIRGSDQFEKLYGAIKKIYRLKSIHGRSLPILAINWVMMKSNYTELPQLIKRLQEDGIKLDLIHCDPLVSYTAEMTDEVVSRDAEGLLEYLEDVREQALIAGIYLEYPYYSKTPFSRIKSVKKSNRISCSVIWESMFLSLEGDIMPCCEYYLNPIGNLLNTDPRSVWNSKVMRDARLRSLLGEMPFPYCSNCHKFGGVGDTDNMLVRAQ